jgi:hypothetical protein
MLTGASRSDAAGRRLTGASRSAAGRRLTGASRSAAGLRLTDASRSPVGLRPRSRRDPRSARSPRRSWGRLVSIGGGRAKAEGEARQMAPAYVAAPGAERRERRPRRHEDDGPPVIGLGDHVPSFLLRPVALRPAKVAED